ncbi:MAG TPA: AAA family ATPase [Polyangia bacterium]|nr:AAA family ATPase [Polyangia bacterium]
MGAGANAELTSEFPGTSRFRVLRRLGEGGMGVVYEALDVETNTRVGLKTIAAPETGSLRRFKNEFRALQGIEHRNLVSLYELMHENGRWFFTMELVEGVDFLRHVRSGDDESQRRTDEQTKPSRLLSAPETRAADEARPPGQYDEARLRSALEQLAHGLMALHRAGKVHRDIKPSNILVDGAGRVALLDFGLVTDVSRAGCDDLAGTLIFMAPEQGTSAPLSPAADWYSVGMLLYLALTGREPFFGPPPEVLTLKRTVDPLRPRLVDERVPADLDELCMALLQRTPSARPNGRQVLEWLRTARPGDEDESATERLFVGREQPLSELGAALDDTRGGRAVSVLVDGESGVGKTTLARHFLDGVRARFADALVLTGRCYERESVPYKAFDEIIDALGHFLSQQPRPQVEALLPSDLGHVAQVFPVLGSLAGEPSPVHRSAGDALEVRRAVFTTVREILRRIGARRPLVLHIDDLHWADEDSLLLLDAILRGPDAPPLLLVATLRHALQGAHPEAMAERVPGDVRRIHLSPLLPDEARALTGQLLRLSSKVAPFEDATIARDTAGHPLFIEALVQYRLTVDRDGGPARLEEALWTRIERLPPPARRLLEAVASAGRPLEQEVAAAAVALEWGDFSRQMALLRASHLLRTSGARPSDRVETYHDRVRETVMAHVPPDAQQGWHARLAGAFEACARGDAETLAVHLREAGELARAIHYFGLAADRAQQTLAFDRAARLYRQCLALVADATPEAHALQIKLGDALANAGRGEAAAAAYQTAARRAASPMLAIDLRRRAAEQLLRVGRIDEATVVLSSVLSAIGLRMPSRPELALVELGARMVQLRLRGFRYRERAAAELPALVRARIDTCWSIGCGLTVIDHIRGAVFQERHLLLALDAGEPYRIARAFVVEAFLLATRGRRSQALAFRLTDEAEAIAGRLGSPHLDALVHMARAVLSQFGGDLRDALARWERAAAELRTRCTDVAWETTNVGFFTLQTLGWLGEVGELSRRLPELIEAAEERGDRYSGSVLRTGWNILPGLAADDPTATRQELAEAVARWQAGGFHVQHCLALHAHVQLALYEGRAEDARRLLESRWPGLRRSLLLQIHPLRLDLLSLRLRCAIACAERQGWSAARCSDAERVARLILEHKRPWSTPLAQLGLAGIAVGRGRPDLAIAELSKARRGCEATGMGLFAAAAQRIHGQLVGGDEGSTAVAAADRWMAAQGIRNPARLVALLAPGFARADH